MNNEIHGLELEDQFAIVLDLAHAENNLELGKLYSDPSLVAESLAQIDELTPQVDELNTFYGIC